MSFFSLIARDLRNRRWHYLLNDEQVALVMSEPFQAAITALEGDLEAQADLLANLLGDLALDPKGGSTLDDFRRYEEDGMVTYVPSTYFWSLETLITVPAGSPADLKLQAAIKANLESRMFKAAKMHLRLKRHTAKMPKYLEERVREKRIALLDAFKHLPPSEAHYRKEEEVRLVTQPWRDRQLNRLQRIIDAATPGFQGSFPYALAAFFQRHLAL